jgi:hypothetical protein
MLPQTAALTSAMTGHTGTTGWRDGRHRYGAARHRYSGRQETGRGAAEQLREKRRSEPSRRSRPRKPSPDSGAPRDAKQPERGMKRPPRPRFRRSRGFILVEPRGVEPESVTEALLSQHCEALQAHYLGLDRRHPPRFAQTQRVLRLMLPSFHRRRWPGEAVNYAGTSRNPSRDPGSRRLTAPV